MKIICHLIVVIWIFICATYHAILGYLNRLFRYKSIHFYAYPISRFINVLLSHKSFTIYRFRLINIPFDYFSYRMALKKLDIYRKLELGRPDQPHYYSLKQEKGIVISNYTLKESCLKSPHWNIQLINSPDNLDDYRSHHLGDSLKQFDATYFLPKTSCNGKWIFYVPGGAFLFHNYHLLSRIHQMFPNYGICFVRYSCLPEKSWPSPIIDVLDSYYYFLNVMKVQSNNVACMSDSAGGNLVLNLLIKCKDYKIDSPSCAVFISPWTDLSCTGDSFQSLNNLDFLNNELQIHALLAGYCSMTNLDLDLLFHPEISPIYGDLSKLPPILIQTGGVEALLDDNKMLASKIRQNGNIVEHQIYPKMPHIFQTMPFQVSKIALAKVKLFIDQFL
eukprot:NODE_329_length_9526_cov_0.701708.p1 type:complete len:390 gc:universal NODE_329_length_9526_cov_0.701708:6629-7798(+)